MNLRDIVPAAPAIIEEAFKHPTMKIRPRAANPYPSLDDALKATVKAIEFCVVDHASQDLTPQLEDALLEMELINGSFEDTDIDTAEWEAALDDKVEEIIEQYVPILSADWLGNHTIGSGIHLEGGLKKFTNSLGLELYKQLTYTMDKSPAKIMSAAGIVQTDIEARLSIHNNQSTEEKTMSDDNTEVQAVIQKIADYVGKDHDVLAVYEDLDLASDDDDNLAMGAAARLGIDDNDVEWLQMERLTHGDETPDVLQEMLKEALTAGKKSKPKKAAAKKKAPAKKAEPTGDDTGSVSAETLKRIKEACEFKDKDVAEALGVSRPTFNNWVNGKAVANLDDEQHNQLRDEIVTRVNLLLESLGELDGTEAQVIF